MTSVERLAAGCLLVGLSASWTLSTGCARRATAYRFRAPLVSSVRAPSLVPPTARPGRDATPRAVGPRDLPAPHRASAIEPSALPPERDLERARPSGPAAPPAKTAPVRSETGGAGAVDTLRARVGQRDKESTDIAFARALLADLGVVLAPAAQAADNGLALLAVATEREALTKGSPLAGDLVLFDRVDGETDASLVGVVVGVVAREQLTVEFVFLARGVVRRGYVTPSRPKAKRDGQGRALNTFVRALTGKAKKSDPFLAGQLFRTFVRIDRLSR